MAGSSDGFGQLQHHLREAFDLGSGDAIDKLLDAPDVGEAVARAPEVAHVYTDIRRIVHGALAGDAAKQ